MCQVNWRRIKSSLRFQIKINEEKHHTPKQSPRNTVSLRQGCWTYLPIFQSKCFSCADLSASLFLKANWFRTGALIFRRCSSSLSLEGKNFELLWRSKRMLLIFTSIRPATSVISYKKIFPPRLSALFFTPEKVRYLKIQSSMCKGSFPCQKGKSHNKGQILSQYLQQLLQTQGMAILRS